jgi:hypothetical protein
LSERYSYRPPNYGDIISFLEQVAIVFGVNPFVKETYSMIIKSRDAQPDVSTYISLTISEK